MKKFPPNIKFKYPWRPYQSRVLEELDVHLDDNNLNIVAAPGSGKTILGLEVALRINQPTLILAPSIAIRNQWVDRFVGLFLQETTRPDWISKDINNPGFLTVSTYQGLHVAFSGKKEEIIGEEAEEENGISDQIIIESEVEEKNQKISSKRAQTIIDKLKQKGVRTIIIDEAHHLRNEWWKSLTYLKERIEKPNVVALTATPPYDVDPSEWKNYQELCGSVDAEISVPELVSKRNLCPHQDYVFLNSLSREEDKQLKKFKKEAKSFVRELKNKENFINALESHPAWINPEKFIEEILKNPHYYSGMIIFLHNAGRKIPRELLKMLGVERRRVPDFNLRRAENLLTSFLYKDQFFQENYKELILEIKQNLKMIGAIERRKVLFRNNNEIKRLLRESVNKLDSISEIVRIENQSLGENLRMVVLTDFIRKEFLPHETGRPFSLTRIGVCSIFEKLRREQKQSTKLGILSGSLIIIPKEARKTAENIAKKINISPDHLRFTTLLGDNDYLKVHVKGEGNQKIVRLITEVFSCGEITVLVGTKSLLGEGWDAPVVNTLVLASFVGSFMLSNQMRGRAIRINPYQPDKVANIWHLASVEKNEQYAGYDFSILKRRFKAFVGVSFDGKSIENGFERMEIGKPPFGERSITKHNQKMEKEAKDREILASKWNLVLSEGEVKKVIPEMKTPSKTFPRSFVFANTIFALFWRSLLIGAYVFIEQSRVIFSEENLEKVDEFSDLLALFSVALFFALIFSVPGLLKSLYLFLRHGPVSSSVKQIGNALLKTLCKTEAIKTDVNKMRVVAEKRRDGFVFCGLEGGTSYEKSLFLDCLEEIFNPVDNPRYLIARKSPLKIFRGVFLKRKDFHAVPEIIATNKKAAQYFSLMWKKYVGPNVLIYTRNLEGRRFLLKARRRSMAASFQKRSERVDVWR